MGGCNIGELFDKYADRLICMDFIDGKYAFAREDLRPPGTERIEKAGSQNATFMLSNRDLGDIWRDRFPEADEGFEAGEV